MPSAASPNISVTVSHPCPCDQAQFMFNLCTILIEMHEMCRVAQKGACRAQDMKVKVSHIRSVMGSRYLLINAGSVQKSSIPLDGRIRDRPTAAQECKLPVCQHCRKLGNHSAGGQHDIFQDLAIVRNPHAASMN